MSEPSAYALGYSEAERERLERQAERLRPVTERFFREAGIGRGCRVLDLGSGMGDVAMLASEIVGNSGEVLGIERERGSVEVARARAAAAGFGNIRFIESDVSTIEASKPFDALIGRFILQFVPELGVFGDVDRRYQRVDSPSVTS